MLQAIGRNFGTFRGLVRHILAALELMLGRLRHFGRAPVPASGRLVFVCLGNINRSAFAATLAKQIGETAASLGLSTTSGAAATPQAIKEASARGVDLHAHAATNFTDFNALEDDLYFVMEVRHARRLVQLGIPPGRIYFLGRWASSPRVHVHDPHTLSDAYFATCFRVIDGAVRALVRERGATTQ